VGIPLNLPAPQGSGPLLLVVPLVALVILAWALFRVRAARRARRRGRLLASDGTPGAGTPLLVSERYGLRGRPDEIREVRGSLVPVEIKSRPSPPRGPFPSHRVQLLTYCLLLEEVTGASPPFGLLVYGDGSELKVPWNAQARNEILSLLDRVRSPYQGEADPGWAKCGACRYRPYCEGARRAGHRR
jgi:CRISPR-associated exonuclease Cas4